MFGTVPTVEPMGLGCVTKVRRQCGMAPVLFYLCLLGFMLMLTVYLDISWQTVASVKWLV